MVQVRPAKLYRNIGETGKAKAIEDRVRLLLKHYSGSLLDETGDFLSFIEIYHRRKNMRLQMNEILPKSSVKAVQNPGQFLFGSR